MIIQVKVIKQYFPVVQVHVLLCHKRWLLKFVKKILSTMLQCINGCLKRLNATFGSAVEIVPVEIVQFDLSNECY